MKVSAVRLVRIIPRKALDPLSARIISAPSPQIHDLQQPTVLDLLQKQREKAGDDWPANIRIEPAIKRDVFKPVQAEARIRLKRMLKER